MRREAVVAGLGTLWLAAIVVALAFWERYDVTAGAKAIPTPNIDSPSDRWRLQVFLHPHCPCSRATLNELREVARATPQVSIRVWFVRPKGTPEGWERTDLWFAATDLAGVVVECDVDGVAARQWGARTSGFAILTDPEARIVFQGGLTRARGRDGESPGRRAILDWVAVGDGRLETPTFGCPLFDSDE